MQRALTALQSFSDSSAAGVVLLDTSEHVQCDVETTHFSCLKLRFVLQRVSDLMYYFDAQVVSENALSFSAIHLLQVEPHLSNAEILLYLHRTCQSG